MSFLKKLVKKAGNVVKSVGKGIAKAKDVLLPIAGVAAGLALPGIGGVVGNVLTKGKDVLKKVTGIGDEKPGIFGIGTGKGILKALGAGRDSEAIDPISGTTPTLHIDPVTGVPSTLPQYEDSKGLPGWLKLGGIALAAKLLLA